MNTLIKNVVLFNQTKDDEIFDQIIYDLKNIITKHLNKVERQYQDDLKQEILITIYEIIKKFKIRNNYQNLKYMDNFIIEYEINFINDE